MNFRQTVDKNNYFLNISNLFDYKKKDELKV